MQYNNIIMEKTFVLSLGGSILVPNNIDTDFLSEFKTAVLKYLDTNENRIIFVVGGGATARVYQNAAKSVNRNISNSELDMIGIRCTHANAEYVKTAFGAFSPVVTNPKKKNIPFDGRILVAGGWKPGFSTDTDAVYLAIRFGAKTVINLSNTDMVYTDNPKTNPNAKPIKSISGPDFQKLVGTKWEPGKNVPFDPIATKLAIKNNLQIICAGGRNIQNTINILNGKPFIGTTIN